MNFISFRSHRLHFFHVGQQEQLGLFDRIKRQIMGLLSLVLGLFLSIPGIPGPGFIFVALAFLWMDFPGKSRAIQWMRHKRWFRISRVMIRKKLNILLLLPHPPCKDPAIPPSGH
ncbi:MAG: hypothetical protein HQL90_00270 [Magnetococcales bacterium]|nr:hypothetical protein [Magnetococcales bacterium]